MRELVTGPRQSGRTTTLLLTMIEEMEMHDKPVFLVVGTHGVGELAKQYIRKMNANSSRVRIICLQSLHYLRGVNPMDVYIEHTAYEQADAWQLRDLYVLEDRKYEYIWG